MKNEKEREEEERVKIYDFISPKEARKKGENCTHSRQNEGNYKRAGKKPRKPIYNREN